MKLAATLIVATALPVVMAQGEQCIPLKGSALCSAFGSSFVSTDNFMIGLYPFLQSVDSVASFDRNLTSFVKSGYASLKYKTLFGCQNVNLNNTTDLYARFTTTVICNGVIQNSISRCNLTEAESPPVCADTCAQYAISEEKIVADSDLCSNPSNYTDTQLRADYTNCGLPSSALNSTNCIEGITNEPENCGFGNSTIGLCMYCKAGGQNSTDSCCTNSQASARCSGVVLPSISSSLAFTATSSLQLTSATSSTSASTTPPSIVAVINNSRNLPNGAIAGIVVGSVVGLAAFALILFCLCLRKRRSKRQSEDDVRQNKKAVPVSAPYGSDGSGSSLGQVPSEYEVLPGGRITHRFDPMEHYIIPPVIHHPTLTNMSRNSSFRAESDQHGMTFTTHSRPESIAPSDEVDDLPAGFASQSRRAPSIAPSEYVILPGGRRVRRSMTITSDDYEQPGSERVISRPASIAGSEREPQPGSSRTLSLRKFSRTRSPRPTMSRENSEYEILPGGRIARKSALAGHVPSFIDRSELKSREREDGSLEEQENPMEPVSNPAMAELSRTITSTTEIPDETMILERTTSRVTSNAKQKPSSNPFVDDHYSLKRIYPGDIVGAIWSYNAKTHDEFSLERGDLIKVVGIWDDGWATGIMISDQRADTWQGKMSSSARPGESVLQTGTIASMEDEDREQEIKAFPIICVCHIDHWRRVIQENGRPVR